MATLVYKTAQEINNIKKNIHDSLINLSYRKEKLISENNSIMNTLVDLAGRAARATFFETWKLKDDEAERLALYDKKDKNTRSILFLETQITELNNLLSSLGNIPSELHIEHTDISKINRFCSGDFTL